MSAIPLSLQRSSPVGSAVRTGLALAVTVAVFYALCALAWLIAQGPFLGFMNSLFHGMDFTPLVKATAFSWRGFLEALTVMFVWAFLAGTFFGWLRQRMDP